MHKQKGITEIPFTKRVMDRLGLEGLCAGYAMDWLRSRLKSELFVMSKRRIAQMADRHAEQFEAELDSTESFRKTADAYGLIMGHHFDWQVPEEDTHEEWKAPVATNAYRDWKPQDDPAFALPPVANLPFRSDMVYYISLTFEDMIGLATGHGFGMDCRGTPKLADWGSGVYECPGMRAHDVFMSHMKAMNQVAKKRHLTLTDARCYYVGLKAMKRPPAPPKPAIPPPLEKEF
jgi:hypothetical protein